MMHQSYKIKKIAVLGAGVMGAQIAAHCVNAGFETLLYDLAAPQGLPNALVDQSIANLAKLKPSPLAIPAIALEIGARNYQEHLTEIRQCDLIIEAIAERMDWKADLYRRISPMVHEQAIVVSNTSGLSINQLAQALPEALRARFCGVHFFNPPRYMHLAEIIPAQTTAAPVMDFLEMFLTSYLGKGVVRAKDTVNFIANRIGVFSLLATLHHAKQHGILPDEVDALTGILLGRPKSATYRTMDVVGLDTMQHVVHTMQDNLREDPWHSLFVLPQWLSELIKQGHLGQKTGQGIYRKVGQSIEVFSSQENRYVQSKAQIDPEVKAILKLADAEEKMQRLMASSHRQARFLVAYFTDLFHYCAYHLSAIANSVRDIDQAMRWGYGWQEGPFETWQRAGIARMNALIEQAIQAKTALSSVALPTWLTTVKAFYQPEGAYCPTTNSALGRSQLAVYQKQFFPDKLLAESCPKIKKLYENEGVLLWHLQDDVAVVNFKSKANTIGQAVIDGLHQALQHVEQTMQGLIVYQQDSTTFSAGADLRHVAGLIHSNKWQALDALVRDFQTLVQRIKYSSVPVVAALRGRALGGGCELLLHCSAVVAAFESYPGLVEAGVGVIPAGGGCKAMAQRAASQVHGGELMALIKPYFEQIATAIVASSAHDALQRGYLRAQDHWVMHSAEVLLAAYAQVKAMQAMNYVPPTPCQFPVAGREGHAILQLGLVNWLEGGFISQHDYSLANQLAYVLCGGDVNRGTRIDETWMLRLEREAFMALASTELTQARIGYLLETGKPLRN